ncbi:Glycosyl transferase, group 2 family protein [Myxococcus hansupus]|uniref:Glycosyl transferase, group 2 family protein n=1 Tax=Pseudomyxococcus hansupus TaxID=1297742 RepID=A0A0H4WPD7_9BACT|nr:glycosyltransferase [Myxococcus hansupus]AKQ65366.1 Glycosyl transferase, group 2 family protein [Myxococcus hansupus]
MSTTRVCLVTDELYPFTPGGIGRVVHNLIMDSQRQGSKVEFHVLMPATVPVQKAQVELFFGGGVKAHLCHFREPHQSAADAHGLYPPTSAFRDSRWHGESLELMRYLKAREAEGLHFDVIEFADFRGWAFATLQEKHLGLAFAQSTISVRLHSSYGTIMHHEPNTLEVENLGRFEIERKSLLDADLVVGHLPSIVEFNRRFYGFDDAWLRKVRVEFPPVVMDPPAEASSLTDIPSTRRNLVFVTKIQHFKQPDVFVRGAVLLMRTWPAYEGKAILACHAFDLDFLAEVKALIPPDLEDRFVFMKPGPDRDAYIRAGVVVITSSYESLNLTAYEASVAGARLVLNSACLAFGDESPFVDGVHCHKYDGGLDSLAAAMRKALDGPALSPVRWSVDRPYWERNVRDAPPGRAAQSPLVSVVVINHDQGIFLPIALQGIAASTYPEVEVIIVDDGSTSAFDMQVLQRLERSSAEGPGLSVVRSPIHRGLAGARNLGSRAARGAYVLFLESDESVSPGFIQHAVSALESRPEFAGVVPTGGSFHSSEELANREFKGFMTYLGDCPSYALVANYVAAPTALLRRSLLTQQGYNEALSGYADWDFFLRLVQGGHRFLVTNQVHAFSRRRHESAHRAAPPRQHFRRLVRMFEGLPAPLHPSTRLFAMLAHSREAMMDPLGALESQPAQPVPGAAAALESAQVLSAAARPLRYDVVDMMNAALKRLPLVHPFLKQSVTSTSSPAGGEPGVAQPGEALPLRYALVDRANVLVKRVPLLHRALKQTVSRLT